MPSLPVTRALTELATDLASDLRYALRSLRSAPAFTAAVVTTLAIGIGANTAMFSVVDGVVLKPLPFSHQERVVTLFQNDRRRSIDHGDVAPANFADWRARTNAFTALAAAEPFALNYSGPDGEEQIYNWNVTQDFFTVLDARPAIGRLFSKADFAPGAEHVLILTYGSWQRRFGGSGSVVGRKLTIGGAPARVVGVLPANFAYLQSSKMEIYAPKVLDTSRPPIRNTAWWHVVGRLAPGVSLDRARADVNRVAKQLSAEYPATNTGMGVTVDPMTATVVGDAARALVILLAAVGMVLLIACANVANLVLARTTRRGTELAIRAALGASRGRLVRQLLAENVLLAVAGGAVGLLVAQSGIAAIRSLSPASVPRVTEMRIDARALAFTIAAVAITTLLFGLLPALRGALPDSVNELKSGGRTSSSVRRRRASALFVTTEVALAVILLVGSGLLIRSFVAVVHADRGYDSNHVLAATVFVYKWNRTPASRAAFIRQLAARAATIPGVLAAGATSSLPLEIAIDKDEGTFTIDGRPVTPGEEPSAHMTSVTPGAFDALHLTLRSGRRFTDADDSSSAQVAIVSEAMAHRYWPNENPIGKRLRFEFDAPLAEHTVVGVVSDVRQTALDAPVQPTIYAPHPQAPSGAMVLLLRTATDPRFVARDLETAVAELNPALPLSSIETLDDLVAASLKPRQFTLSLFVAFAACALLLAVVGVYAVISQRTAERWQELAVRIALGAQARDVVSMTMRQGLVPVAAGVAIGLAGAVGLSILIRRMLFIVSPFDLTTFGIVCALMVTTAMVACYIPARRGTRVDPLAAIRAS
jgi:putative ABC transport system permease protein